MRILLIHPEHDIFNHIFIALVKGEKKMIFVS